MRNDNIDTMTCDTAIVATDTATLATDSPRSKKRNRTDDCGLDSSSCKTPIVQSEWEDLPPKKRRKKKDPEKLFGKLRARFNHAATVLKARNELQKTIKGYNADRKQLEKERNSYKKEIEKREKERQIYVDRYRKLEEGEERSEVQIRSMENKIQELKERKSISKKERLGIWQKAFGRDERERALKSRVVAVDEQLSELEYRLAKPKKDFLETQEEYNKFATLWREWSGQDIFESIGRDFAYEALLKLPKEDVMMIKKSLRFFGFPAAKCLSFQNQSQVDLVEDICKTVGIPIPEGVDEAIPVLNAQAGANVDDLLVKIRAGRNSYFKEESSDDEDEDF